jgi:hypothetical protein
LRRQIWLMSERESTRATKIRTLNGEGCATHPQNQSQN